MSFAPGDVATHQQLTREEGLTLEHGLHFGVHDDYSVLLLGSGEGFPRTGEVGDEWRRLVCSLEGEMRNKGGSLTQPGRFLKAAQAHREGGRPPQWVRVYDELAEDRWAFNGSFELVDGEYDEEASRFTFTLVLMEPQPDPPGKSPRSPDLDHVRMIPTDVKRRVWGREGGACALCGSCDDLHIDHKLPFSRGGDALSAENLRLLCGEHHFETSGRKV